ncbi:MAG: site-specific integrase [Clostridia bacterium]|mgnify:FL=1|jgi:integrase|nr:site-specific integrase [Clostridia bacterium]
MKENKKKNSIGTIRKRGNRYEGRVYVIVDGKSVQKSVYGDTEREVNDKMRAKKRLYEEKQNNALPSEVSVDITVEKWIKIWVRDYKKLNIAQSTLNGYISKIKSYIIPYFKGMKVIDVGKRDFQLMINGLIERKKPLSYKTRKDTLGIGRMIFQSAIDDVPLIEYNPAVGVKLGKKEPPKEKEIMSIEEQLEVMQILMSEYNGIAFFALFTLGVRASELAGLLWKDLDEICENIKIDRGFQVLDIYDDDLNRIGIERKYTDLKSYNSHRKIPVISILKEELLKYKRQIMENLNITDESELDNESIFRTKLGNISADYLRHRLNNVLRKYNLRKVTVHELRHTFATRCLESGIDMKTLQMLLGHADYSTTANIYAHVLADRKNMELLKYNRYMANTFEQKFDDILNLAKDNIKDETLREKTVESIQSKFEEINANKQEKIKQKRYIRKLRLKCASVV